jgi:hypothetical protein
MLNEMNYSATESGAFNFPKKESLYGIELTAGDAVGAAATLAALREVLKHKPSLHEPLIVRPRRPIVCHHRHHRHVAVPRQCHRVVVGPVLARKPGEGAIRAAQWRPRRRQLLCPQVAAVEEEELLVHFGANVERVDDGGGVGQLVDVASAIQQVGVGDSYTLHFVEDGLDSVGPERVLEVGGGVVTCYLEGLVAAALRRMRAGEPERVGDGQVPAPRRRAGRRRVRSACSRGGPGLGNEQ